MTTATTATARLESLFEAYGHTPEQVQKRLDTVWRTIFEGPDAVYHTNAEGLGYVVDTGNNDVRTEGMSYAMMLAVQYGRRDVFDALWGWVMAHMYMPDGFHAHYFAWSVNPDGRPNSNGPAPDGEEWFAMDLFLADARWGSDSQPAVAATDVPVYEGARSTFDYAGSARALLHYCVHQAEYGGQPMWNSGNHLIKFIPETEWSDPSYHLPHFYEVFAQRADPADRDFWRQAAASSRDYLKAACHPQTGLNPEYANYDGSPHIDERGHWYFFSDAYRTVANIGLDSLWNGLEPTLCDRAASLQRFLATHDDSLIYDIEGNPAVMAIDAGSGTNETEGKRVLHPVGLLATTAAGSLAARHSQAVEEAEDCARRWVERFWQTPMRTGPRRYYDNFLYAFASLALAGEFKIY